MKFRIAEAKGQKYYRAVFKYLGKNILFTPNKQHGENIDDEGYFISFGSGGAGHSEKKELSASKYVGGAVYGAVTMNRGVIQNLKYFIYEINEEPDIEIKVDPMNDVNMDFEYIQEVRYYKPVKGTYLGKVFVSEDTQELFGRAVMIMTSNETEDEEDERILKMLDNGRFGNLLKKIRVGNKV